MTIEVFSLVVLLVMFVVASVLPINLGIMGFVAAFVIGALLGGLTVDDLLGVFPATCSFCLPGSLSCAPSRRTTGPWTC